MKCSVTSDAIAEGQDVLIQKYLKVTMMLKMHPYKASPDLKPVLNMPA